MQPDYEIIEAHLTRHFGGFMEGLIEIAGITPNPSGAPRIQARQFGLDKIEDAATYAAQINSGGANAYFGVVPRREDMDQNARASDADCLPAGHVWLDLDDAGAAEEAAAIVSPSGVLPCYSVVTGRHPHTRVQMFFSLDEPMDAAQLTDINKRLALTLSGDDKVTNIGRIMRLGGTVAWPSKEGRIPEMTEFRPQSAAESSAEELTRALALDAAPLFDHTSTLAAETSITREQAGIIPLEQVTDGREEYMRDVVAAKMIEVVGEDRGINSETVNKIFERAWDTFSANADTRRPGHATREECLYKSRKIVERLQSGGIANLPNVEAVIAAHESAQVDAPSAISLPVLDEATGFEKFNQWIDGFQPPEYLWPGILTYGTLCGLSALTGAGKTAFCLALSIAVARGDTLGNLPVKRGNVVFLCGENPLDVRMRCLMICKAHGIDSASLNIYFYNGSFDIEQSHDMLAEYIEGIGGCSLLIVDTLIAYFVGDDDNSNVQMAQYARDALRPLTQCEGNPVVLVPAHPPKHAKEKEEMVPRGGGAFLNELDANYCVVNNGEGLLQFHWAGKIRGGDFDPVDFILEDLQHPDILDSDGNMLRSVSARAATDDEVRKRVRAKMDDEDDLLLALSDHGYIGALELAEALAWYGKTGAGDTKRVGTVAARLAGQKMIKYVRNRWELTSQGEKEADKIAGDRTQAADFNKRIKTQ